MRRYDYRLREWWSVVRKHPYADLTALLFFIVLGVGGIRLWVRPTVLVTVDGRKRKLHTASKTVGEALMAGHIMLGPEDICNPPPETRLARNTAVHVTRVTHNTQVQVEKQKPRIYWRVQLKANLRPVLVERGFVQEESRKIRVTLYDGVITSQNVLKRKTTRRPIFTLTLFNHKTGQPAKTYDLAKARRIVMRATGYYVGERTVPSDTTFLGIKLQRGLVAVDPKVIPLKTRLYIKGYGYAYAADTGSAIKGNRIDVAVKDKKEEAKFNRQKMTVYILEKASTW
jgi:3D (Asp-Asp-Asp) domain-containing protein